MNISTTVYTWLRELRIPVSKNYIEQQLNSHPDYPSLLSITDTLNELGIANSALKIEKEQLAELPAPFIAHLDGKGGEFVIVMEKENPEKRVSDFFKRWNGVVIAAEKRDGWVHKQNSECLKKDENNRLSLMAALSLFTLFTVLSVAFSFSWMLAGLLLIAITGVFISWMIMSKDLGIENKMADELCGVNADCTSVIHSKAARLPFNIGWSDAGMIYFTFLLITLLVASLNNTLAGIYSFVAVMASASIPITIISIYYQWRVIKKWCRLCLITVALLGLQFIVLLPETINLVMHGLDKTAINNAPLIVFLLFITSTVLVVLKRLVKKNKKLESENYASKRFSRNPDIFYALLEKQKSLSVIPNGLGIVIGNPHATNTIIKVCNPYCGPCAKAHPAIERLLEEKDNLKVQIIFTASNDEKDLKSMPVKLLMALDEKKERQLIQRALDDWYAEGKKDYNAFAAKYVLNGELERQGEKLAAMKKWCEEMKISFTPTFFVNGYQLPEKYNIEEVKYFLE